MAHKLLATAHWLKEIVGGTHSSRVGSKPLWHVHSWYRPITAEPCKQYRSHKHAHQLDTRVHAQLDVDKSGVWRHPYGLVWWTPSIGRKVGIPRGGKVITSIME